MGKIPGMAQMKEQLEGVDADSEVKRIQGIIDSMTPAERSNPALIDIPRRRRIATGAGVDPSDVSGLIKQFDGMAALMKQIASMSMLDRLKTLSGLGRAGAFNPGATLMAPKGSTGKRLSPKERAKLQKEREKLERKQRREMREQRRGQAPGGPA
jgi:signal recognition particle subunit SRP54